MQKTLNLNHPKLFIITGAGISAPSGLDTFRTDGGIWNKYDLKRYCFYPHFLKNQTNFNERFEIFDFYQKLKTSAFHALPNKAHYFCAKLQEKIGLQNCHIITTNIDNLHEKAGAQNVMHLHGSLFQMLCCSCFNQWNAPEVLAPDQQCPSCASPLTKPNVIFFGEHAPQYQFMHEILLHRCKQDVLLVIGSSLQVVGVEHLMPHLRLTSKEKAAAFDFREHNILLNMDKTPWDHLFSKHYLGDCTVNVFKTLDFFNQHFHCKITEDMLC